MSKDRINPIYLKVEEDAEIRQGDIFCGIPKYSEFDHLEVSEVGSTSVSRDEKDDASENVPGATDIDWERKAKRLSDESQEFKTFLNIRPTIGIVLSQDCDVLRKEQITLLELNQHTWKTEKYNAEIIKTKNQAEKYINKLKEQFEPPSRQYLPQDTGGIFPGDMYINFHSVLYVDRLELKKMKKSFRLLRLNCIALNHFRHKLNAFFLRYASDLHYVMNQDEYEMYKYVRTKEGDERNLIVPFPHQKDRDEEENDKN